MGRRGFRRHDQTMSVKDRTTLHIRKQDQEVLDRAAKDIFTTTDVPRRRVILRLAADHEDVNYSTDS